MSLRIQIAQILDRRADLEDVVIAADHPDRCRVLQDAARFLQPFAGELVVGGEAVELVPIVGHGVDMAAVGTTADRRRAGGYRADRRRSCRSTCERERFASPRYNRPCRIWSSGSCPFCGGVTAFASGARARSLTLTNTPMTAVPLAGRAFSWRTESAVKRLLVNANGLRKVNAGEHSGTYPHVESGSYPQAQGMGVWRKRLDLVSEAIFLGPG
jgi:hypothetical protein